MIFVSQLVLKISFDYFEGSRNLLTYENFAILTLSTLLIAAGGYVINDYFDVKADWINKPKEVYITKTISNNQALYYYSLLTFLGIALGCWLCYKIDLIVYSTVFFLPACLLFFYSYYFQKFAIIGNLVTSSIVGFSLYIVFLFENLTDGLTEISGVFLFMVLLAICINFIREIIKDIQDMNGDFTVGFKTLPIIIGTKRALLVATFICLALVFNSALFACISFREMYFIISLLIIGVSLPLGFLASLCYNAENPYDYKLISRLLKMTMLIGIVIIPIIIYLYKNA